MLFGMLALSPSVNFFRPTLSTRLVYSTDPLDKQIRWTRVLILVRGQGLLAAKLLLVLETSKIPLLGGSLDAVQKVLYWACSCSHTLNRTDDRGVRSESHR
jgi:hypothetical protein